MLLLKGLAALFILAMFAWCHYLVSRSESDK